MGPAKGHNEDVSKGCLGSRRGAYARRCPKEVTMQISVLLPLFAPLPHNLSGVPGDSCGLRTIVCDHYNFATSSHLFLVSKDNAVSFRDSMAYLTVKPTSVTDYNNAIDAMTVAFRFKTTKAEGVIFYGKGRTSLDYITIKIQSQSRIRAEVNMGSKADFLDLKVNGKFDDDKSHSVFFEFNRKELTFTVDGETKSIMRDPFSLSHLDLDGEAFFVGGGHGISEGFVGCVSGLVSAKISQTIMFVYFCTHDHF